MASITGFALVGVGGGIAIGALAALSVPLTPVPPARADVGAAVGNPAASSSISANDQAGFYYGSTPIASPARPGGESQVAYMPTEVDDAAMRPADVSEDGAGQDDAPAALADDTAGQAADAARDAADDARVAGATDAGKGNAPSPDNPDHSGDS